MKKQFFAAAMILALGAGFTACSSDDLNVKEQKEVKSGKTATGYLTYAFSVATPGGTRAATNDQQGDDDATATPGYNFVERWKGNDQVTKVTAYIFDGSTDAAQLEVKDVATNFTFDQESTADGNKTVIKPTKGVKVTVGEKTVYLVVNPTTEVDNLLDGIQNLGDFKTAYTSSNLAFANRTTISATATSAANVKTAADALYTPGGTAGAASTIVMTGAPVTHTVVAGINEGATAAEDGTVDAPFGTTQKNRFNFTMKRAVATVFVTSKEAENNQYVVLKGDNPLTNERETNAELATVSELKFSQAQGEVKLYFQQKAGEENSNTAYQTPAYSFITTADNYNEAAQKYDYNGLWKENSVVQVNKEKLVANDGEGIVKGATVVPFLPATHQWTTEGSNYKEGNTAYVLVRAKLTPKYVYVLTGDALVATAFDQTTHGAKFFYGSDNKFYASKEAVAKAKESNASLKAKMFTNGKGLYTVWINPDTPTGKQWKNSPTNRNNIYHISITGIKSMPENWNPLVPPGVANPDPKPKDTDNPNEPDPKHKPENPLSPVETWMSVDATILPWSIHSYGVEL
jgi:pga67 protein